MTNTIKIKINKAKIKNKPGNRQNSMPLFRVSCTMCVCLSLFSYRANTCGVIGSTIRIGPGSNSVSTCSCSSTWTDRYRLLLPRLATTSPLSPLPLTLIEKKYHNDRFLLYIIYNIRIKIQSRALKSLYRNNLTFIS